MYLIRNGSERTVTGAREHLYDLRGLENYTFTDEHGKDQGLNGIRFAFQIMTKCMFWLHKFHIKTVAWKSYHTNISCCTYLNVLYYTFILKYYDISVRHKVKEIVELIQNDEKLRDERKKAKKNKDKYKGMAGDGFSSRFNYSEYGYSKTGFVCLLLMLCYFQH